MYQQLLYLHLQKKEEKKRVEEILQLRMRGRRRTQRRAWRTCL